MSDDRRQFASNPVDAHLFNQKVLQLESAHDEIERLRAEVQRLARELDACEGHLDVVSTGSSNREVDQ